MDTTNVNGGFGPGARIIPEIDLAIVPKKEGATGAPKMRSLQEVLAEIDEKAKQFPGDKVELSPHVTDIVPVPKAGAAGKAIEEAVNPNGLKKIETELPALLKRICKIR